MKIEMRVWQGIHGKELLLTVERTKTGWDVYYGSPHTRGGDKTGWPVLYMELRHDSIQYPAALPLCMRELWDKAESGELNPQELEKAVGDLGDWISEVEKATPETGFWKDGRTAANHQADHSQGALE